MNPGEQELQEVEEKLLVRAAECTPDPLGFYSALKPWEDHGPAPDRESKQLQSELMTRLQALELNVVVSNVACMQTGNLYVYWAAGRFSYGVMGDGRLGNEA